jgi:transcriptional regulator with XRE-family HTH domain
MSSIRQQTLQSLRNGAEYRHAFAEEAIRSRITAQIKTMREQRHWDYRQFAEQLGKSVSWTYRLEDPNIALPTIPTLLHVARTLDIGLDVRFRAFSELLDDVTSLGPESFAIPSFEDELTRGFFLREKPAKRKIRVGQRTKCKRSGRQRLPDTELESKMLGAATSTMSAALAA